MSALLTSGQGSAESEDVPGPLGLAYMAAFVQFPREALARRLRGSRAPGSTGTSVLTPEGVCDVGSPRGPGGGGRGHAHRAGGRHPVLLRFALLCPNLTRASLVSPTASQVFVKLLIFLLATQETTSRAPPAPQAGRDPGELQGPGNHGITREKGQGF